MYAIYITYGSPLLLTISRPLRHTTRTKRASNQGKTGQNQIFVYLLLSHLGDLGDRKGQKPKIFLKCGCKVGAGCGSACLLSSCPLVAYVPDSGPAEPAGFGSGPLVVCSLLLSALSLCLCCAVLEYGLFRVLRAFLEGFMGFVCVCVVLVLRAACVAFVRVNS